MFMKVVVGALTVPFPGSEREPQSTATVYKNGIVQTKSILTYEYKLEQSLSKFH